MYISPVSEGHELVEDLIHHRSSHDGGALANVNFGMNISLSRMNCGYAPIVTLIDETNAH